MNGIHDMGGMDGFGPVDPTDDDIFHNEWEKRVFALCLANGVHLKGNSDSTRFRLEQLPPTDYLKSYFERWLLGHLNGCLAAGIINELDRQLLVSGQKPDGGQKAEFALSRDFMERLVDGGTPTLRKPTRTLKFKKGDQVRARNLNPPTHSRLPRYVKGKQGTIIAARGTHVFPDTHAQLKGEAPEPLYTVRFTSMELWGEHAPDTVTLDLWEPYLEAL